MCSKSTLQLAHCEMNHVWGTQREPGGSGHLATAGP